jgi:hypothetical protein
LRGAAWRSQAAAVPVNVRVHQNGETVTASNPASAAAVSPSDADRQALAAVLNVRLQEIETSLQKPQAAGADLSAGQRAELERQQVAIKRALARADQSGWLTDAPVVVDTTLRQLLGPMAAVLTADAPAVDRLA